MSSHRQNLMPCTRRCGSTRLRNDVNCEKTIVRSPSPLPRISHKICMSERILALCLSGGEPEMRSAQVSHRVPVDILAISYTGCDTQGDNRTYLVKQTSHLTPPSTPKPPSISASSSTCCSSGAGSSSSFFGSVTSWGWSHAGGCQLNALVINPVT